ncbi:MAG: hypothetical protein LBQ36_07365 [Synergistaceae bacterium]|jgi:hypothetical protein|nr:hypothetical protein [Synergistaceae bacterium]
MKSISLKRIDAFKIIDENTDEIFYGCDQEWFGTEWQRRSGCGPSAVSNMLLYRAAPLGGRALSKSDCASLMEEVWHHVTPTEHGIPNTEMLCESVKAYGASKGAKVACAHCEIPEDRSLRPSGGEVASFLEVALSSDIPVIFLNLCNGEEENLDEWHWVTIVSLERAEPDGRMKLRILDKGKIGIVDLTLWLDTTECGGGFVHFVME